MEKIQTIGDAYLAVSGIPNSESDHAQRCVLAAKELMTIINKKYEEGGLFEIRVEISQGPAVAEIVVLYTHLRAKETGRNSLCVLLLEKKNPTTTTHTR